MYLVTPNNALHAPGRLLLTTLTACVGCCEPPPHPIPYTKSSDLLPTRLTNSVGCCEPKISFRDLLSSWDTWIAPVMARSRSLHAQGLITASTCQCQQAVSMACKVNDVQSSMPMQESAQLMCVCIYTYMIHQIKGVVVAGSQGAWHWQGQRERMLLVSARLAEGCWPQPKTVCFLCIPFSRKHATGAVCELATRPGAPACRLSFSRKGQAATS